MEPLQGFGSNFHRGREGVSKKKKKEKEIQVEIALRKLNLGSSGKSFMTKTKKKSFVSANQKTH